MPSFSSTKEFVDTTQPFEAWAGHSLNSSDVGSFSVLLPRSAVRAGPPFIVGPPCVVTPLLSGPCTEGPRLHLENYIAMHEHLDLLSLWDDKSLIR